MRPIFRETNRLRLCRRYVGGYALLFFGLYGLMEMFAEHVLGWGTPGPVKWSSLVLHVLFVISGVCNLLTTKAPTA